MPENTNELNKKICQSKKMQRTLIRVSDVYETKAGSSVVQLVIPSWNPHKVVVRPLEMITAHFSKPVRSGDRFHARVNIDAACADDLLFSFWEE